MALDGRERIWNHIGGIYVDIPANFAYDRGVWVHVRQGIRGILVPDERGNAVCYMVCEPSSHYYQIMTKKRPDAAFHRRANLTLDGLNDGLNRRGGVSFEPIDDDQEGLPGSSRT